MNQFNPFHGRSLPGLSIAILTALVLSGCGGDSTDNPPTSRGSFTDAGVIATASSDFESGAVELVDLNSTELTATGGYFETLSDIAVVGGQENYYRLGRFNIDTIQKVEIENPGIEQWQYSALQTGESGSANPKDLVIASPTKAYLLRYGKADALIVDLSATNEADFVTGTLDLSDYTPANGSVPGMSKGVIVDGKLYIAMQRLDDDFKPTNDGYVAVFDTSDDTEIDTNPGAEGLKGIPLIGRNPSQILYQPGIGLMVQSDGQYGGFGGTRELNGGIDVINTADYSVSQLIDDTEQTEQITGLAVASDTQAYFISYAGFGNTSVISFDPSAPATRETVGSLSGGDYRALAISPSNNLWVADANASMPGVRVIETAGNTEINFIMTTLLPIDLAFVTSGN
jgi:hypothetical protein